MTLEDDGNLHAYYWTSGSKAWTLDYRAISEQCELPERVKMPKRGGELG